MVINQLKYVIIISLDCDLNNTVFCNSTSETNKMDIEVALLENQKKNHLDSRSNNKTHGTEIG